MELFAAFLVLVFFVAVWYYLDGFFTISNPIILTVFAVLMLAVVAGIIATSASGGSI